MKKIFIIMIAISSLVGSDIYKDAQTGLMWQDNGDVVSKKLTWDQSKTYCQELSLGGYNNWRLPSVKELQSIIDKNYDPAIKKEFKHVAPSYYWSNSVHGMSSKKTAWSIYFKNGTGSNSKTSYTDHVRCVRMY